MPKTVPNVTRRQWLELYDGGVSYAKIAKKENKDIKTVRAGIEAARREQWVNLAQAEMYKHALYKHQTLLVEAISDLLSALVVPDPETRAEIRGAISGGTVSYTPEEGLVIALDVESKPEWALLREHLKRHKLWKALTTWKEGLLIYLRCLDELRKELVNIVDGYTQLPGFTRVKRGDVMVGPSIYKKTLEEILYQIGISRARDTNQNLELEKNIIVDGENVLFRSKKIAKTIGDPEDCRLKILDFLTGFNSFRKGNPEPEGKTSSGDLTTKQDIVLFQNKVNRINSSYASLKKSTEEVTAIAQEIILLGIITGNCHVCSKLGV